MAGFGSIAPYYDPMTGLPLGEEPPAVDPTARPGLMSRAANSLLGVNGQPRFQTWPEKLLRSAVTMPGDVLTGAEPMLPPGLRREDYTDIPAPQVHGANTTPGIFGNTMFTPQAAQPNDPVMERAQDLAGMAGGGMMFGRMAGPGGLSVGRDLRVLGRKVGSGEPFPHQLIDQPAAVAQPYIPLGPADAMQRPIEARMDADLGRHANDSGLTSVARTGRDLLSDSATPGAPLAALESSVLPRRINPLDNADQLKELANQRRARGENVGQSAPGWDFKRPDPEPGTLEWDNAVARAEHAAATPSPESPLLSADDHAFISSGKFLSDSATPGAPLAAAEHAAAPRNVDWKTIDATERKLSPLASHAMDSWVGGTVDTMKQVEAGHHAGWGIFNRSAMDNPEALQELRTAFQPLRDQLKAEHGNEVTLYRYHGDIPEGAKPHGMLSFTNDKKIAEGLSGARKERPIVSDADIAAKEAEFEKTGRLQISKNRWLEKKKDMIWNGKENVPVEYTAIMEPDGMVTDTPSVREYFEDANDWNRQDNAKRDAALAKVKSYKIPVDDIVAATNRFGQQEFVVRNTKGLFEDAATTGAPVAALEHSGQAARDSYLAGYGQDARPAVAPAEAPAAPRGDGPGGAGGGDASLREAQAAAARRAGDHAPLEGLPTKAMKIGDEHFVPGPISSVRDVAAQYMADRETPSYHTPPTKYHPLDEEHSKAIARAFDEMKHEPNDPATKASYDALIKETADQYQVVKKSGLKIEPIPAGAPDPYAKNPRLAAKDVADNNHLWFFPTDAGFGSNPGAKIDMASHPMMRKTGEKIGDHELLANDMFRIVHDYFGHLKEGYGFRAAGEDNAWRSHASMYSDLARPAMTTETRGQNSWVNYGPHGEHNRTASGADTVYADQKVGLMPEWTMRDRGSPEPTIAYHGSPYSFDKFDPAHIGAGEGNQAYGHGLYFAGHEPVSEWYRHQLAARRDPILQKHGLDAEDGAHVGMRLATTKGDPAPVIADLEKEIAGLRSDGDTSKGTQNMIQRRRAMVNYLKDGERNPGHMYQVAIDAKPEEFLDWDKPLKDQPKVLEAVRKVVPEWLRPPFEANVEHGISGANAYQNYAIPDPPKGNKVHPHARTAQALREAGVPGIKYLDQGSRKGGGTSNYVTFSAPRLLKKYAAPGLIGAGGFGSLAPRREQ